MKKISLLCLILLLIVAFTSCSEETQQKGTIKGKVTNSNQPVNGCYVLLLDSGELVAGNQPIGNGMVTNAQGDYTIYLVEPNKYYYIAAVQDIERRRSIYPRHRQDRLLRQLPGAELDSHRTNSGAR